MNMIKWNSTFSSVISRRMSKICVYTYIIYIYTVFFSFFDYFTLVTLVMVRATFSRIVNTYFSNILIFALAGCESPYWILRFYPPLNLIELDSSRVRIPGKASQ